MLKVEKINVSYGDMQVLWDVSFEVKDREIVVLLGANGAGKSTVLKSISGLIRPSSGSIDYKGIRLNTVEPHKIIHHGLVHVPEGRRLFPDMTVEENLIMGSLTPTAKKHRKQTLEWVCELFGRLNERLRQPAGTLSGGEQQMVAIGRGLMARPEILMLDEPSLGLAPVLVEEMLDIVKKINTEGVTILMVEQNVMQSLDICTRAYVLEHGRIALEGTGKSLKNNDYIKKAYLGI